jgi:hypothetical protein
MTAHRWFEVRKGPVPPADGREPSAFGAAAARAILPYAGGLLACAYADTAALEEVAMEAFSRVPALHELRGVALSKTRRT